MMKKLFSVFFVCLIFLSVFSSITFATNFSWQASYFNKLVEVGEKPGLIKRFLTGKDSNGFYSEKIFYALNDYNQDDIPELVIYGINSPGEHGDNYQIYTYDKGKVKKFKIINREGPSSENVSFSDQPHWPYYTNFFFLPNGYTDKITNELIWILKTTPNDYEFWAIAGTLYESENIFEVSFDFQNMSVDIIPIIFAEITIPDEYQSRLEDWKENHKLTIHHDEYGRAIPDTTEELWKQLIELDCYSDGNSLSDLDIPDLEVRNKFLIFRNKVIESEDFWITFWGVGFLLIVIVFIVITILIIKRLTFKRVNR